MPRPRKPSAQKRLEGTDKNHPSRMNPNEPVFRAAAPPMPAWLSPQAQAEWKRLIPLLQAQRVLAETDLGVMAAYCADVGDLQIANQMLAKEPRFYKSKTREGGYLWKEHPAAKASRELGQQVRLLANELGLSPAARSKVSSLPEEPEADPMAIEEPAARRRRPVVPVN